MIQYSCNLSCRGCITMTNYQRKGSVSSKQGDQWLSEWSQVLDIGTICLFGGEPLMNKDLLDWIKITRQYFPNSTIKIISNGLYLENKNILPELFAIGNVIYQISLHWREGPKFNGIKQTLMAQLKQYTGWKPVGSNRDEVSMAFELDTVLVQLAVFGEFTQSYQGYGNTMLPWASDDPAKSYAICGSPQNPILYKNRVYKCGPIANLRDTLGIHNLLEEPSWQQYLSYTGYASSDDLTELVSNFDKPNAICSMCSKNKEAASIDHYAPNAVLEKREIKWVN